MTLQMEHVVEQLPGMIASFREQLASREAGLAAARAALARWNRDPEAGNLAIERAMAGDPRPFATTLREPPALVRDAPPFAPVTVVAADGSSIEPDRFAPVQCFVVNTGHVVLPYGTSPDADLGATAWIGPRSLPDEGEDHGREDAGPFSWGVNLHRDVSELSETAHRATDVDGEVVALLDGTLLPWDLDSPRVAEHIRDTLAEGCAGALRQLREAETRLSVGAYVSGSRSSDLVSSLRALAGGEESHWPLCDAPLFARSLARGQRTAVFRSRSQRRDTVEDMLRLRGADVDVCFFYLCIGDDIARVELPAWAASDAQVDRLHATLVQQCAECGAIPAALQEAHEQAVISTGDRLQFEPPARGRGRPPGLFGQTNSKQMSKRRRAI
jgi:hypothetical protein